MFDTMRLSRRLDIVTVPNFSRGVIAPVDLFILHLLAGCCNSKRLFLRIGPFFVGGGNIQKFHMKHLHPDDYKPRMDTEFGLFFLFTQFNQYFLFFCF